MGDRYRDYLKAQKKVPVAKRSGEARGRGGRAAAEARSKAIKRQQGRKAVRPKTWTQERLDGW